MSLSMSFTEQITSYLSELTFPTIDLFYSVYAVDIVSDWIPRNSDIPRQIEHNIVRAPRLAS